MIGQVLEFLRSDLDAHIRAKLEADPSLAEGANADEPSADERVDSEGEERVRFLDGDRLEALQFRKASVSMLLMNIEEERQLRSPDLFHHRVGTKGPDSSIISGQPDIRLVLYVLLVARFPQYEVAWDRLSLIIQRFQTARVFRRDAGDDASLAVPAPTLPEGVERLILEFVPLDFARQNDVWNALRTGHHPSIMYRVQMVTFREAAPKSASLLQPGEVRSATALKSTEEIGSLHAKRAETRNPSEPTPA